MRRTLLLMSAVLFSIHGLLYAQDRIVTGKVVAQDGKSALPGVSIAVKGTALGTSTDEDGNFTISLPDASSVLVFSFIGYKTIEVTPGTRTTLSVELATDATQLTEIVVTGYGDAERKALTGTINTVSGKQIQDVPIASIDQILQGRSPGVLVMGSSGQPGAAATVTIRGRGSISASTTPLYVLDGVPIDPTSFNTLNPNDYDIVNILTDASATSIYGSRAANGVILLNSKKGKAGKTKFTYKTQYGVAQRPSNNKLKLMNSNQKIDYELMVGGSPLEDLTAEEIDALRKINTDWAKVLFQNATYQTHEVSAQGGNEKTTFFFSGAYLKQDGTVKTTSLERYTSRLNLAHESGPFRFGVNSTFGFSKNKLTREGDTYIGSPLNAIRWANPYETPYDENGEYTAIRTGQPNPLQELRENTQQSNELKVVGNIYAAYELPIKGLTARTSFGMDYGQADQTAYNDRTTNAGGQATGNQGSLARGFGYDARFINTNSLNYSTTFGEDHSLSVGLYQETNFRQVRGFNFTGYGLTGNLKNEAGLTVSGTYLPLLGGNNTESGLSSVFGDVRYGFKDRYHLSVG
ncbi:MAG TPA: SusC/RagA family TonB-linked outer membrane protein, partial [Cyclobacteriaceae bacterium]|nr:SusC/RagA family TonB-linked outer membrane protein [Cyclobacteriaceae bacterium]